VVYPYGRDAFGMPMYGSDGNMSVLLMRRDRPKFALRDRLKGTPTPEEIKSCLRRIQCLLWTYEVNEEKRTVTHHVEGSSFPNCVGTAQVRFFQFSGRPVATRHATNNKGRQTVNRTLDLGKNKEVKSKKQVEKRKVSGSVSPKYMLLWLWRSQQK